MVVEEGPFTSLGFPGPAPRRAIICGSAKTVYRYQACVAATAGIEVRAVEVLQFRPNAGALTRAARRVIEAQQAPDRPLLQLVVTSSATVHMLQAAIDDEVSASGVDVSSLDPARTAVLTIRGCGTEAACRSSNHLCNVVVACPRLRDVYLYIRTTAPCYTVLMGVATGGDRSYRSDSMLSTLIEEFALYETVVAPEAAEAVRTALAWAGPWAHVVVTSSKSAQLLAMALTDPLTQGRQLQIVAQGQSTASVAAVALRSACPDREHCITTAPAPTMEAIGTLIKESLFQVGDDDRPGTRSAHWPGVVVAQVTAAPRIITLDEVAKHATRDDAWMVVDGVVYDITPHVKKHPGWTDPAKSTTVVAIMAYIGKDATQAWHAVHSHAERKVAVELGTYEIGVLPS
jgi:hypothetical protein